VELGAFRAQGLNHLHAWLIVEELCRNGVEIFCVSPGARAIPLLAALQKHPQAQLQLFNDERAAAFWAQGFGKAGGLACLVCTSGTAAANYLPGVVEAFMSSTPLLVVTTDRPGELRYAKANQTIEQMPLFAGYTALTIDIPAPDARVFPAALLANIDQAVAAARTERMPVHLNIAYRKPFLDPDWNPNALEGSERETIATWYHRAAPYCTYVGGTRGTTAPDVATVVAQIDRARHILCVCGPLPSVADRQALLELAERVGAPIFADIHSGLRSCPHNEAVFGLYNLYLRQLAAEALRPDLILYFGDRIVSEPLRAYLDEVAAAMILVSHYPHRQDAVENELLRPTMRVIADPCQLARAAAEHCTAKPRSPLRDRCKELEREAGAALPVYFARAGGEAALLEGQIVSDIFAQLKDGSAMYVSASLPLREAEYVAEVSPRDVLQGSNRGATGIDGVLSSSLGFARRLGRPTAVLIGDQALLHDLNALALVHESPVPLYVFVINNSGGAIFHFFDLGATTRLLINPHAWDFHQLANAFKVPYVRPQSRAQLAYAFSKAQQQQQSTLFEMRIDGTTSVELFQGAAG
jgi:2-succinyl-5-enolpyruvyl-6-hydroxy-3-cyclohexene-1-carboxylate synthase